MTAPYIDVFVPGTPVPQGSLRASRHGHLYYSNAKKLTPWRRSITEVVLGALCAEHEPINAAVHIEATFWFPRPKSVKHFHKLSAPDTDKLFRAIGDGLTDAQLYTDDSRVVAITASKWYADVTNPPGARIRAWIVES